MLCSYCHLSLRIIFNMFIFVISYFIIELLLLSLFVRFVLVVAVVGGGGFLGETSPLFNI